MNRPFRLFAAAALAAAALAALPLAAQERSDSVIVSLYRAAPGKQLELLKWMAAREAADRELGIPATQWFIHHNGASWDLLAIAPDIDKATSDRSDAAASKRGLATGMRAGLEFRQMIAEHSDTFAGGPYSAQQLVDMAGK